MFTRALVIGVLMAVVACHSPSVREPLFADACERVAYPALAWRGADSGAVTARRVCVSDALEALTHTRAELGTSGACGVVVELSTDEQPTVAGLPSDWREHPDAFAWTISGTTLTVFAAGPRGAHYAVHAIRSLLASSPADLPAAAADWPAFPSRGMIEGFYGPYFSSTERTQTLSLMHQLRQNIYLYAPKDDPFAGYQWRDAYPAAIADDLRATAAAAAQLNIDFVFGISPTLATSGRNASFGPETSIRFASEDDVAALMSKLQTLRALGIQHFALQFDDVDNTLFHADDRAAFATAAAAHAALTNRVVAEFGGPVWFVGTTYTSGAAGWQTYVQDVGARLDPSVNVMWTGPSIFPKTLAPADLLEVNQALGRHVHLWDNWPIEPKPITGRDAQLFTATPAMMTNMMMVGEFGHPVAELWQILGPLGDYGWRPTTYDANASYAQWQSTLTAMLACAH